MATGAGQRRLASPNYVPIRLCAMVQRLAAAPRGRDRDGVEQDALTAIFLAVTTLETFTNIYSRTIAEEAQFAHARAAIHLAWMRGS